MTSYTLDQLARLIDHTNLHPTASEKDMELLCQEAHSYHFKMVAINQVQTSKCQQLLANTDIGIGAAISFPLGQTSIESKTFETADAIKNGATEIDYVINLTAVKDQNWSYLHQEMAEIVAVCRQNEVTSKVIFENCYLTDEEKIKLCEIAKLVQPDFIKTSTGFGLSGATIEDVRLMKQHVGDQVKVKAAGGIRDAETFKKMLAAGAERIGTSAGIAIIDELKNELLVAEKNTLEVS